MKLIFALIFLSLVNLAQAQSSWEEAFQAASLCRNVATTSPHVVGLAYVYFSSTVGRATFGHAGLRFLYCESYQIHDVFFDYYPQQSRLYLNRQTNPLQYYNYFHQQHRSVSEVWLKVDSSLALAALERHQTRYELQGQNLENGQPLPSYSLAMNNCLIPILQDFSEFGFSGASYSWATLLPYTLKNWLEAKGPRISSPLK